jgi:hypothetical protein
MVDPAKGASHNQPLNLIPTATLFILDVMEDTEKYREKTGGLALGKEESDKKLSEADKKVENEGLAISYVKNGKLQELEEILDEDIHVDTADENGNTLLLVAAQQVNANANDSI